MDEPGVARIFTRVAGTYDRTGPAFLSHFGRRLAALAEIEPGMRVLDVATGRGAVVFPCGRYGQSLPAVYVSMTAPVRVMN